MRKLLSSIGCALLTFSSGAIVRIISKHLRPGTPPPAIFATPALETRITESLGCERQPRLPIKIKAVLDRNFPGWRFHIVTDDDCEAVRTFSGRYAFPQMIQGDFDGNNRLDYALLIDHYASTDDRTLAYPPTAYVLAFLATGDHYLMRVVTRQGGGVLLLMPKSAGDYDYGGQREFTYANDTIFCGEGMGGMSYLYENGKFRALITSD